MKQQTKWDNGKMEYWKRAEKSLLIASLMMLMISVHAQELTKEFWNKQIDDQLLVKLDQTFNKAWQPQVAGKAEQKMKVNGLWLQANTPQAVEKVNSELASFARIKLITPPGNQQVKYWFRTEGLVRGKHPYYLVFDDIESATGDTVFDWAMPMPLDASIRQWRFQDKSGSPFMADLRISQELIREKRKNWLPDNLLVRTFEYQGKRGAFGNFHWESSPALNWPGYFARYGANGKEPVRQYLFIPGKAEKPAFKIMLFPNDGKVEVPQTFWQENRSKLIISWRDQVDELRFQTGENGLTNFVLERISGNLNDEVIAFGTEYQNEDEARKKGKLIGHWSFDETKGDTVFDSSEYKNHGKLFNQAHLTSGVNGKGLDPVSVPDMQPGEVFTVKDAREQQPPITFGRMILPGKVMDPIKDQMTLSMWYTGPPTTEQGLFWPYHHLQKDPRQGCQNLFTVGGDPDPSKRKEQWNRNFDFRISHHWSGDGAYLALVNNHRVLEMLGIKMKDPYKWHHIALVIDKQNVKLYYDGKLAHETNLKKGSLLDLKKGEDIHVLDGLWARIDELRLHDYPLLEKEIKEIYRKDGAGLTSHFQIAGKTVPENPAVTTNKFTYIKDERGFSGRMRNTQIIKSDGNINALKFNKDSQLQIPHTLFYGKPLDGITVALKVKFDSLKGRNPIFNTNNHARHAVQIGHWNKSLWCPIVGKVIQTDQFLETGKWYSIIVTYDNYDSKIFIDGELVKKEPNYNEKNKLEVSEVLTLGQQLNQSDKPAFEGEIADIQLFNYAVSDAQAKTIAAGKKVTVPDKSSVKGARPEELKIYKSEKI